MKSKLFSDPLLWGIVLATTGLLSIFQLNSVSAPRETLPDSRREEWHNPANWAAAGGCWDFSRKIIEGRGMGTRPVAYFRKKNYTNFVYEIRLRQLSSEDCSCGLVFRFDEKKNAGYVFSLWPHGGWEFVKIKKGDGRQVTTGSAIYLNDQLKTWNTLKVVAHQNRFEFYLNDQFLVTVEDNQHRTGKIGFYLGHGPMSFLQYEILTLREQ